ncbi:hypothetical protein RQ831_18215 [Roseomonas gilardii]|uniref:Uncharacterized protein n=1 Tax=Roseomonas gilardii TaxID=257708 RepID=A0ABU3MJ05_9PROT|nr:hypothetical protein [Roseomonas gilardii]MDT8332991.1 hypothetical protein [Roseomonas gilardii]
MADRDFSQAATLNDGVRGRLLDALYDNVYKGQISREDYDQRMGSKSDYEVADSAYKGMYQHVSRDEYNRRVGLTSASGSTQNAIASGVTFGLMDEAAGVGAGVGSFLRGEGFGKGYSDQTRVQRENAEIYRQNNPYLGTGLEVAGGLATGGPALARGGTAVAGATPSAGRTVATAAGMGAAQGAGQGEGLEDRLVGAGAGAALGAGMAAVVPLAIRMGGGIIGKAMQATGMANDDATASRLLLKALEDDGMTPRQAVERLTAWQREGAKPETLFDIGGENTRRLARAAAGRTGPGTDQAVTMLAERQADQAGRVAGDVQQHLGQNADDFFTQRSDLLQKRAQDAAPLYEKAFSAPAPTSDKLQAVLDDPIAQAGLAKGLRIQRLENTARAARGEARLPTEDTAIAFGDDGVPKFVGVPNMRSLDAIKRGLDETIEAARDGTTGKVQWTQELRAVDGVRRELVNLLDNGNPAYAEARAAYAGPSQSMDAMARGRGIFSMRDADTAKAAAEAARNPGDADFFRMGVAQAIQERVASGADGADAIKRIFGSPAKRALLRASFPDQKSYDAFAASMRREAAMYRNAQFVSPKTGSQTAMRMADDEDLSGQALSFAADAATGGLRGAVWNAGQRALSQARGMTPEVSNALVQRLFTSEPDQIVNTLRHLGTTRVRNALAQREAMRRAGRIYPALTSGTMAGVE